MAIMFSSFNFNGGLVALPVAAPMLVGGPIKTCWRIKTGAFVVGGILSIVLSYKLIVALGKGVNVLERPRWFFIRRQALFIILGLLLLSLGFYYGATIYREKFTVTAEQLVHTALERTIATDSLRFNMVVKVGAAVLSDVQGERCAPDSVKIAGTMQDLPIEFIHITDKTYIKGYWSDQWVSLSGNTMAQSELFVTEFNPMGNFNFKSIPQLEEKKPQVLEGNKYRVVEIKPILQNSFMELNYSDFVYTLWIDPKAQIVARAYIQAQGKNNRRDPLSIDLKLYDFNQPVEIKPPR